MTTIRQKIRQARDTEGLARSSLVEILAKLDKLPLSVLQEVTKKICEAKESARRHLEETVNGTKEAPDEKK